MYYKNTIIFALCCVWSINLWAQETWSLEKCVQHALQHNISVQQTQIAVQQAQLDKDGNRFARLPNLNASSSYGYQFGRTIDPTSNSFINQSAGSNTWSLNSNVTLYNGGRISKSIKQSDYNLNASEADKQQAQNDLALNVANAYLNVLFAEEQYANAQTRLQLSQAQLDQTQKLIRAGQIPENDKYDILATIAQNEQAIIVQQNNVDIALLNLKQLLQLDIETNIQVEHPDLVVPKNDEIEALSLESVYNQALQGQAFVQADNWRLQSAEMGVDIAKSGMYPRLSLFGSIDTRYSTEAIERVGSTTQLVEQTVVFNGQEQTLQFQNDIPVFDEVPYFDQINDNLGQTVGLSLNIPIYNNHTNKNNIERAKLNIINAQLTSQRNRQQLKTDVQTAIANAKAAQKQLEAAEKTKSALAITYENAQKRLNLGAINTFQLTTAKNNLDTAEVDYIIAKYDYLFKLKIVDFYLGKPIRL